MKLAILFLLMIICPLALANECISVGKGGYEIKMPRGLSNLSINGDSVAYCAKFNISPEDFASWLTVCGIELDSLPDEGEIKEIDLTDGFITIINTQKNNQVYFEIVNTKDEKEFKNHIGVTRECTL